MECPICLQCKYSKDWRPCQWKACSPSAHGFVGCRGCDTARRSDPATGTGSDRPTGTGSDRATGTGSDRATGTGHVRATSADEHLDHWTSIVNAEIPGPEVQCRFAEFCQEWVLTVLKGVRKNWSHEGAIRCREVYDQRQWFKMIHRMLSITHI